jgi:hypothetical protein
MREEKGNMASGGRLPRPQMDAPDQHSAGKPDPNPEWEAKADAAHEAIRAEVGDGNPFDTLTMLETWTAHAEPADCDGRITFSRALLDSAKDGLRAALELARGEHLRGKMTFITGAQECREMMARFVEQGGDTTTAQSIRANWNPSWGHDPGPPRNVRDHGWLGPDLHDKAEALVARARPAESGDGVGAAGDEGNLPPDAPKGIPPALANSTDAPRFTAADEGQTSEGGEG